MKSFCHRLLQQLAFRESCHFSWDQDPARTMAYCIDTFSINAKVTDFLPFCTIGISMYQKKTLPYILFLTHLPLAYSPLERSRQTDGRRKFLTPCSLSPFFPTERAGPYPQAQLYWAAGRTVGWMANRTRRSYNSYQ